MPYSSRLSPTRTIMSLYLGGLLLICSGFAASAEFLPAIPHTNEAAWAPSPAADVIADELRKEMTAGLRNEMVAALQPTSVVWKGALDGRLLAQEMREQVNDDMKGEMITGLMRAFAEARNPAEAPPVVHPFGPLENPRLALARPNTPTGTPAP